MARPVEIFKLLVHLVAYLDTLDLADLRKTVAPQREGATFGRFCYRCHIEIIPQ